MNPQTLLTRTAKNASLRPANYSVVALLRGIMNVKSSEKTEWKQLLDEQNFENKKSAPAADRNKKPILEALAKYISQHGKPVKVLEVASGTGQHAAYLSQNLPHINTWQPSDVDPQCLTSIPEWTKGLDNVLLPLEIDASKPLSDWPVEENSFDLVYSSNLIHIAPYCVMEGLIAAAGKICKESGWFVLYGPFMIDRKPTTESNAKFHETLMANNPSHGLRDFADVNEKASNAGLKLVAKEELPANNFLCVWKKQ